MSLTNYTDLQTSVANHLHRSDLTSIIPDLITLAEHKIYSDLDARQQDTVTTLSTVAATETVTIPADFINARTFTITSTSPHVALDYKSPDQYQKVYAAYSGTGLPQAYTIIGSNFYLAPTPDAAYTIRLVYQAKVPSLSSGTNWLMTSYPAVYLYATLCASAPYLKDDARVQVWEALYQEAIQGVNSKDWANAATMQVKGDVKI